MKVDPNKHSSFHKLLLRQGFKDEIQIPPGFMKENKKMLAKTCLLKSNVVGMSWKSNIVRKRSNYFICEREWTQFVVHHQLQLGDVLLFFLIHKSTFQVLAYNQKSHRNNQQFEELSSSSGEKQEDVIGRNSKRVKTEPTGSSGNVAEKEGVESGNQENGPKKIRFSVVNLNSNDPYYEMVIKKSHSSFMTIPVDFARWAGLIGMKKMNLDNGKGKDWEVFIERRQGCVRITRGWPEFKTHNKIATGETYRFKLIWGKGSANNVLQVLKIYKPHSLL
ncbi:hypothetical protein KY285_010702 [Solanum tuberosum]|nr:hypothetical protein KY289_011280 [Solanum tuberosum]KAH0734995.1 hypothetical protein KY285_010702 [Solanum tuberosum]